MYTWRYGWEIVQSVLGVLYMFDVDYRDSDDWAPTAYMIATFVIVLFSMPIFLYIVLTEDKWATVKYATGRILEKHYGFEKEK